MLKALAVAKLALRASTVVLAWRLAWYVLPGTTARTWLLDALDVNLAASVPQV
jgi:hypothetical protein